MKRTTEQLEYTEYLQGQVDAASLRVRVVPDVEGFPIVPGRLGQVEYYGAEWRTGERRLRVFTDRGIMIKRLLAIPGVHRQQMGDGEARMWFPADAPEVLREVCRLIRARVKRQGGTADHLAGFRLSPGSEAFQAPRTAG